MYVENSSIMSYALKSVDSLATTTWVNIIILLIQQNYFQLYIQLNF